MLKAYLNQFISSLIFVLNPNRKAYRTKFANELSDKIDKNIVYILGEGKNLWSVAMKCPCNCGEVIQLSLHNESRPKWSVNWHFDGTVSLHPSVWRKAGCKSHFFVKKGLVIWA